MKLIELAHFTTDVEGMAAFYRAFLSAEPVAQSEDMAIFVNNGVKIFIHRTYLPKPGELPAENHTAFEVENVDATCIRLTAQGMKIETAAQDYYWGRSAYLRDPDGNLIEITKSNPPG